VVGAGAGATEPEDDCPDGEGPGWVGVVAAGAPIASCITCWSGCGRTPTYAAAESAPADMADAEMAAMQSTAKRECTTVGDVRAWGSPVRV
jgi:hypothetical protein